MNKITCICLGVKDMEKAIRFYRDGLGYKLIAEKLIRRYAFLILREQSLNYFL